ncbi:hypothetical protein ACERIT_06790 [Halopenitus sp. H-Gu1]|uniref:hypothetical protein n=1 Tax=Halopenitus sp. H-Gu1 TaxID=3242697 RepID=UPI00359DA603
MNPDEIWNCDDRYQAAGQESAEHLWPKPELDDRREKREQPWFDGDYRFERTVADWVPDCFIIGGPLNRWFEFVARSDQPYRVKTRAALRLGFVIYWVFHIDHQQQLEKARRQLIPELKEPFTFGVYDPRNGVLELGDPITYKNYEFPVERMAEFRPQEILGYRPGAARIGRTGGGFDLGRFSLGGCQYRLIARDLRGTCFRAVAPGKSIDAAPWGFPTEAGLEQLVEAGQVTRLEPVPHRDDDADEGRGDWDE